MSHELSTCQNTRIYEDEDGDIWIHVGAQSVWLYGSEAREIRDWLVEYMKRHKELGR